MAKWWRRNAIWLSSVVGGTVFNIALQKGWLDRVPDSLVGLGAFAVLCLFLFGVYHQPRVNKRLRLLYIRKPKMLMWGLIFFFAFVGAGLGRVLFWVIERESKTSLEKPPNELVGPKFGEDHGEVKIRIGEKDFTYRVDDLKQKTIDGLVLQLPGTTTTLPIRIYIEGKTLFSDVSVLGASGPAVKIEHNVPLVVPPNWDYNYNDSALEIVSHNHSPAYQLIYERPGRIRINGFFLTKEAFVYVWDDGIDFLRHQDAKEGETRLAQRLKRIFKYPSWQHRGEYDDSTPTPNKPSTKPTLERKGIP